MLAGESRPMAARTGDTPPYSFKIGTAARAAGSVSSGRQPVSCQREAAGACCVCTRSSDDGSAETFGRECAAECACPVHAAAGARRTRPHLQQPEGCVQEQEDERAGPGIPGLPDMLG